MLFYSIFRSQKRFVILLCNAVAMRSEDDALFGIAKEQRYLLGRQEILSRGATEADLRWKLQTGLWQKRQAGVYQVDRRPQDWRDQLMAALLAAGPGSLVSHRAAMVLWELDGISSAPIEITAPYSNRPMPKRVIVHRTRRPMKPAVIDGISVTTPERTLLDGCSDLPTLVMTKALESAIRKRLATEESIYATLVEEGGRGVKGTRKLRFVLADRISDTSTDSGSETELLYHMRATFLPLPILGQEFFARDGQRMVPDFYWPDRHKAVEVDGLDAHDSAEKLDHDLKRQNALMDLGIELRRFSAREVRRNPQGVVAEIRQFLEG